MIVLAGGTGDSCCADDGGTSYGGGSSTCTPPTEKEHAITAVSQQNGLWCWAACTNMLLAFHGSSADQCAIANKVMSSTACCGHDLGPDGVPIECPFTSACNRTGWLAVDEYGMTYTTDGTLSWDDLVNEIGCDNKSMAWVYGDADVGDVGHMVVIKGYASEDLGGQLIVNDPMLEAGTPCISGTEYAITYEEYVTPSGFTSPFTSTLHNLATP